MIAYKATYNGKCRNQTYKVGYTYTASRMKICKYGIHFCVNKQDTLEYYQYNKDFQLLEIEVLGDIDSYGKKSVTDKMKVLRIVPFDEYNFENIEFDESGHMISKTDSDGYKVTYKYDESGNMISKTDSNGYKVTYKYDESGNMISKTKSNGYKYTYEYTYEYDESGNMTSMTDSNGYNKVTYKYDESGNMTSMTDSNGYKYTCEHCTIIESIN
jgi:YD repeat-containing protein